MTHPSHNHGERRGAARPSLIVIHYTGMADAASARDRLCDPAAEVSAHWLIHEDGTPEPPKTVAPGMPVPDHGGVRMT